MAHTVMMYPTSRALRALTSQQPFLNTTIPANITATFGPSQIVVEMPKSTNMSAFLLSRAGTAAPVRTISMSAVLLP